MLSTEHVAPHWTTPNMAFLVARNMRSFSTRLLSRMISTSSDESLDKFPIDSMYETIEGVREKKKEVAKEENGINNCPKNCLCSNEIEINYKNVRLLSQFVSSQTGMIFPRTYTKICMKKQRQIAKAIKRSRAFGYMPYTYKLPEYLNDPKLF